MSLHGEQGNEPNGHSDDSASLLNQLERQVERGNLFAHTALGEGYVRIGEAQVFVHGLLDLLLFKGLVTEEEVSAATANVRQELIERGELSGPGIAVRIDELDTTPKVPAEVDCEARMHICQAVCCRLNFALSVSEVESGKIKWDLGQPYFIRHEANGYCTHNECGTRRCKIYADRPAVCRNYSCVGDSRIWKDFDNMVLNEEWIQANLSEDPGPRLVGFIYHRPEMATESEPLNVEDVSRLAEVSSPDTPEGREE